MIKKTKIGILFLLLLFIFVAGCDLIQKDGKGSSGQEEFKRGPEGLVMEFVENFPGDRYIVSDDSGSTESISIIIDVRNKGTFPKDGAFSQGNIYLSGFDNEIIDMELTSKELSEMFLQGASSINPLGGFDTADFEGQIIADTITIDKYDPIILATICYPYITESSPAVCVDPLPFDSRQEKVCQIGTTKLSTQGAPVAVTRIDQEASTNKIQFKIHIKNVGNGDVIKPGEGEGGFSTLEKCSPLDKPGITDSKYKFLHRKDFDRVKLKKIEIGSKRLHDASDGDFVSKCSPFADGSNDIRLFDGEGFVICTLDISDLDTLSAYTTPLNIELEYNYRSTISKKIEISKLTTIS